MARTRTTIRRIDPWSILKFGFVANLVLLGIQLLAGTVVWYVIQRLELIQTVCELAGTVGFEECGVDGGALFDTVLVLGLLGVVIQTGILVFLTFLANLIFDLTGGIVLTLEDDRSPAEGGRGRAGVGSRSGGAAAGGSSFSRAAVHSGGSMGSTGSQSGTSGSGDGRRPPPLGTEDAGDAESDTHGPTTDVGSATGGASSSDGSGSGAAAGADTGPRHDDDPLFGRS